MGNVEVAYGVFIQSLCYAVLTKPIPFRTLARFQSKQFYTAHSKIL